jgi:GNAT superfamily N-acetyltransferase
MDVNYLIRKATVEDADFLADVIIGAEKSMTNNLGLATFFELKEEKVKELLLVMLKEEIDGCEFSVSSFFAAYNNNKPVAALGGWLEGYYYGMSSALIKSNLINATFPKENIIKAQAKLEIIKDIQIERELDSYQLEYSFVDSEHRGKRLTQQLMKAHLEYAKQLNPSVKKAQLQVFENNEIITKVHEGSGYRIVRRYVSNNKDILNYMPHNVKLLMEKEL